MFVSASAESSLSLSVHRLSHLREPIFYCLFVIYDVLLHNIVINEGLPQWFLDLKKRF